MQQLNRCRQAATNALLQGSSFLHSQSVTVVLDTRRSSSPKKKVLSA